MAFGIEVWNAAGQKTLSYTDRISRVHLQYDYNIPTGVGELAVGVPGIAKDGTWAAFALGLTPSWLGVHNIAILITPNVVTLKKIGGLFVETGTLLVYRI